MPDASHSPDVSDLETIYSLSTNATDDDLPGPGRNLGNAYAYLGRRLVDNLPRKLAEALAAGHDARTFKSYSTESTNITADNLIGPGRLLGNVYVSLGNHLEGRLGSAAGKLGYGPQATAVKIQKHRQLMLSDLEEPRTKVVSEVDRKYVIEHCKRLLRYAKSPAQTTRSQAADWITEFSVNDRFVRGVFKALGAEESLMVWLDIDPSPLNNSRRALISVSDVAIHCHAEMIMTIFTHRSPNPDMGQAAALDQNIERLISYVSDEAYSFLAIRYFQMLACDYYETFFTPNDAAIAAQTDRLLYFIDNADNAEIEWELCDKMIAGWLLTSLSYAPNTIIVEKDGMLGRVLRFAKNLPRTLISKEFQWLMSFNHTDPSEDYSHEYMTYRLLRDIATYNADDSDVHKFSYSYLKALYPYPGLEPLLLRLSCRPDTILCQIINERRGAADDYNNHFAFVINRTLLNTLCVELAQYIDCEDIALVKRAVYAVKYLLTIDIYCRTAIQAALLATRYATSIEYDILLAETGKWCMPTPSQYLNDSPIYRHRRTNMELCISKGKCGHMGASYENLIQGNPQNFLYLRVYKGTRFSSKSHTSLFAGHTADRRRAFLADGFPPLQYCAIPEGAYPDEVLDFSKIDRSDGRDYLSVYVLRYAPETYKELEGTGDGPSVDETMCYAWRPGPVFGQLMKRS